MGNTGKGFAIRDITQIGLMVALIEVSKFALSGIPNVELTSFWLIMFTLYFGWSIIRYINRCYVVDGRDTVGFCSLHRKLHYNACSL